MSSKMNRAHAIERAAYAAWCKATNALAFANSLYQPNDPRTHNAAGLYRIAVQIEEESYTRWKIACERVDGLEAGLSR